MMKPWIAFLFSCLLMIFGTTQALAAVRLATPEQDRYAKQALPPAGKALIYVYRLADARLEMAPTLWLNKRNSGQLEPQTYGMWAAGPGRLEVRAGRVDAAPLTITCEAGRVYFVQLAVNADGRVNLRQVPYGTGRTEMRAARLVLDPAIAARTAVAPKPAAPIPAPAPAPAKEVAAVKEAPAAKQAKKPRDQPVGDDTSEGKAGVTLIFKGGSFSLGSDVQSISADVSGVPTPFQTTFGGSATAFGLDAEWRTRNGWAFGGEAMVHSHKYTAVSLAPASSGTGDMQVVTVLANAKKYFRPQSIVQPYVGAGIGIAVVNMSGQLEGTTIGYSIQAMGGVAFRWEHVGIYTEAKFQANKASDVDASGSGLFAGMSVQF
jgi:opacity protein-like surface antigen